jgi:hypothetical protein
MDLSNINWLAVLVASIINMGLGTLWYGPLFGKPWMAMNGMSRPENSSAAMKNAMFKSMGIAFLLALIMNTVLGGAIALVASTMPYLLPGAGAYMAPPAYMLGVHVAFFIWLGFVLIVTSGVYLWEGKPLKLWAIHASYYLVLLLINGALLASWV